MHIYIKQQCFTFCFIALAASVFSQKLKVIHPGKVWPDNNGKHIEAHGGGIIKLGKTYYWYGEDRSQGLDSNLRYVSCYSSKDLINWKFKVM